jgi:hypothetical protein
MKVCTSFSHVELDKHQANLLMHGAWEASGKGGAVFFGRLHVDFPSVRNHNFFSDIKAKTKMGFSRFFRTVFLFAARQGIKNLSDDSAWDRNTFIVDD